jgi:hypothetical protein
VTHAQGRYLVKIHGEFSTRDVRRLERLCGSAFEQRELPLTLEFAPDAHVDPAARRLLDRLVTRGATVSAS